MGERGTNRSRDRIAAEVREPRHALRHGHLDDTDRSSARPLFFPCIVGVNE